MTERKLTAESAAAFHSHLTAEEKSATTIEKYLRDLRFFAEFAGEREVTKELVREWKASLSEQGYAPRSINSMLASLNSFLLFMGWGECRVKSLKIQQQTYSPEDKELTREEYLRLLDAARGQPQLRLVMETICATGIRVSELRCFTVEAVRAGEVEISSKGKLRPILIPGKLRKKLLDWARSRKIETGAIFVTRSGKPLDRSGIWARMKKLCEAAGVAASKVFPHNLRKLFARCFYALEKDIAKLADILGHSSINTTRIYLMSTGREHRRQLDRLGLVV